MVVIRLLCFLLVFIYYWLLSIPLPGIIIWFTAMCGGIRRGECYLRLGMYPLKSIYFLFSRLLLLLCFYSS